MEVMSPYSLCRGEYSNAFSSPLFMSPRSRLRDLRIVGDVFVSFHLPLFLVTTSTSETFLRLPPFPPLPLQLADIFIVATVSNRGKKMIKGKKEICCLVFLPFAIFLLVKVSKVRTRECWGMFRFVGSFKQLSQAF